MGSIVTMSDIAKKVGVSRSTTSGVLNNHEAKLRISPETRRRVLEAAEELGYRRNELARSVAAGKSYVLGFLKQESIEQEALMLDGVLRTASDAGYLVKVLVQGDDEHYDDVVRNCIEHRLAGLVLRRFSHSEMERLSADMRAYKIPFVFIDDDVTLPGVGAVTSDDSHGIRLVIDHVLSLGHRGIAYLAGDCSHPQGLLRRQVFLSTMRERGISTRANWVRESKWDIPLAEEHTSQIFRNRADCPTALLCDGDQVAAVAMRTLWKMGFSVPDDVSVTGYAGFEFGELLYPPLTSIMQPFEEMGAAAVRRLLRVITTGSKGKEAGDDAIELLPTKLIVRESTSRPRTR